MAGFSMKAPNNVLEQAVRNAALPTLERRARHEIVVKDGFMYSRREFCLEDAYNRGTLSFKGLYTKEDRYYAAKRFSEMALKSVITSGSMNFEVIRKTGYVDPLTGKLNIIHQVAEIRDCLDRAPRDLLWEILVVGQTMKDYMPRIPINSRPKWLCSALDDLVQAFEIIRNKFYV